MIFRTACISVLILSAAALPTNTEDPPPLLGWTGGPDGRGTLSILTSCVLTLWLCVYAAMHLNVPAPEDKEWTVQLRYLKWVLVGLLAPEIVVAAAWDQHIKQKVLGSKLNDLWEKSKGKPGVDRKNPWTKVHGFHAVMGGYAFGIDSRSKEFLPDASTARCTLTPEGLLLLAECGHLPDLSEKWIIDKSKADGIAKLLVCIQALWMIIQTIGRLSGHLTVTLLEINTIGHVLCALGIYILWWYKPREVGQAVVLEGDWVAPLYAFMIMCSGVKSLLNEPDDVVYFPPSSPRGPTDTSTDETTDPGNDRISRGAPISSSILHTDGTCGRFQTLKPHHAPQSHPDTIRSRVRFQHEHALQTRQISRHCLAAEAIHRHPVLTKFLTPAGECFRVSRNENSGWRDSDGVEGFCITRGREFVTTRAPNTGETRGIFERARHRAVMWFLTIVYGGVHMAAWNDHFPSEAEKLLWWISTSYIVYIGVGGIAWDGLKTLTKRYARSTIYNPLKRFYYGFCNTIGNDATTWYWNAPDYFMLSVIILAMLFYVSARVYIVVEAFISLRSMPADSYDTPNWSELIPHL